MTVFALRLLLSREGSRRTRARPQRFARKDGVPGRTTAGRDGVAPSLRYFRDRLRIPEVVQVVLTGQRTYVTDGILVVPAQRLLPGLA